VFAPVTATSAEKSAKISLFFFADFFLGFGVCEIEFLQKSNQHKLLALLTIIGGS
jgi:hypothetical protein